MPSSKSILSIYRVFRGAVREWMDRDVAKLGAALAFYTLFAIAPLLIMVLAIAGFWFGEEAASRELFAQISGLVGAESGKTIQALVVAANRPLEGASATLMASITLLAGATGVFVQLQDALNFIWNVPRRSGKGIVRFIRGRVLSFALILAVGFLLLVSLVISATLAAVSAWVVRSASSEAFFWEVLNLIISIGIVTLLFAIIFKVLPDVHVAWRVVWRGALVTALLFNLGKHLFGLYLGRTGIASAYGAAGSLVVVLLWVYYSAQILLFGATLTQIYSRQHPAENSNSPTDRALKAPTEQRAHPMPRWAQLLE
ncbi:MAG: YihY/virulence factor BrkB family protein [Verrucomicrobiales bacterium]|nr:YihY/virulence factor BrkB family protein [Verrucomicrobiales bacterium]